MRRVHLVELEDLESFPAVIRDGGTAFLRAAEKLTGAARLFAVPLARALNDTGYDRIVDLCSGGAGTLPEVLEEVERHNGNPVSAVMTDKYPNAEALAMVCAQSGGRVTFRSDSVDATDVPAELDGFRTIFNAFHHFPPALARAILQDAVRKRTPIAVFEIVDRWSLVGIGLTPLLALLLMPTVRPIRLSWWALTYVVPAIPFLVLWDGFVSCLRVYDAEDFEELLSGVEGADTFEWRIERPRLPLGIGGRATICIGLPQSR